MLVLAAAGTDIVVSGCSHDQWFANVQALLLFTVAATNAVGVSAYHFLAPTPALVP